MQTFGGIIKQYRTKKRLTINETANSIEVSPGFLSMVENNKRLPSKDVALRLIEYLEIPKDDLLKTSEGTFLFREKQEDYFVYSSKTARDDYIAITNLTRTDITLRGDFFKTSINLKTRLTNSPFPRHDRYSPRHLTMVVEDALIELLRTHREELQELIKERADLVVSQLQDMGIEFDDENEKKWE